MNTLYRWAYAILAAVLFLFVLLPRATAGSMDDFFPRGISAGPPAGSPMELLPVLHGFHASTSDTNPGPPWFTDNEDEAKAMLVAALYHRPGCPLSNIGATDAGNWTFVTPLPSFRKTLRIDATYTCTDPYGNVTSGPVVFYGTLGSPMGCVDIDDGIHAIPEGAWSTPYGPMNCWHRLMVDHPPCCDDGYNDEPMEAGNPINFGLGRKVQRETDYKAPGDSRLSLQRYYEEHYSTPRLLSKIGRNWNHSFNRSLLVGTPVSGTYSIGISEPSGHWTWFKPAAGMTYTSRHPADMTRMTTYVSMYSPADTLTKVGLEWHRHKPNDDVEIYDVQGRNTRLEFRGGRILTLLYDALDRLASVEDEFGRALDFSYGANGHVSRIDLPDNTALTYDYSTDGKLNLTTVHLPDGTTRKYSYDTGSRLTGIVDENGLAYLNIAYNTYGKAVSTSYPNGVNRFAYSGASASGGPILYGNEGVTGTFDLVTPLGATIHFTTVNVKGSMRPATVSAPCPECGVNGSAFTYDANGNVTSTADFSGKKVCHSYDLNRNLETVRADGILVAENCAAVLTTLPPRTDVHKVSTAWHAMWQLPSRIAEPNRITYYAYNGDGGVFCAPATATGVLCNLTVRATTDATGQLGFAAPLIGTPSVWQYTYNQFGQELTAADPFGKFITTTYYANGNVRSVTTASGEVITINSYDSGGRPISMTDADGTVKLTYWPRGWLRSYTDTTGTTNYTYDKIGQLTKMLRPDGSYLLYTYDAAHRLTQVKDELGNRVVYTLGLAGNIVKVETFDPSGALTGARYYLPGERLRTAQMVRRKPMFQYHGNWCGPDWTGGFQREYGQIGMWDDILPPIDALDKCCYTHDICYWECRCDNGCNNGKRKNCMKVCDRALASCADAAGHHRGSGLWWYMNYGSIQRPGEDSPTCYGNKD